MWTFQGVKDEQFTLHRHMQCYVSSYCNIIMFLRVEIFALLSFQVSLRSHLVNDLYPPSLYARLQYESQIPVYTDVSSVGFRNVCSVHKHIWNIWSE